MAKRKTITPRKKEKKEISKRSHWRGVISFGLINIAVQLYPAVRRTEELHFNLLDKKDHNPIGYKQFNKVSGKDIPRDQIVKGYEYEPSQFVIVTDDDFQKANPKATQSIDIHDFINMSDLDFVYFQRPYYLWPGKNGEKGYALLLQALSDAKKVAIAEIVLSKKQHLCVLIPREKHFMLELLYYDHEIEKMTDDQLPEKMDDIKVSPRELEMAQALVKGMSSSWKPEKYHDTFYQDMMKLIEAKARRGEMAEVADVEETPTPTADVVDLLPLLKKSLRAAQSHSQSHKAK
jgi:DNA end-binding protein Ku